MRKFGMCVQRRHRSACSSVQSDLSIRWALIGVTSSGGKLILWSNCADAQTDLSKYHIG